MTATEPMFLFSLPRAGSTLLQRILGAHPDVATASEPWLLLPLLYSAKDAGMYAVYDHSAAALAIREFSQGQLPGGLNDYRERLASAVRDIYARAGHGKRFFLDKTPRYHLIVDEILEVFPHSPVIFLWRHPLAVAASMSRTWLHGRWAFDYFAIDLFDGLQSLTRAFEINAGRVIPVRYEDLVSDPERTVAHLLTGCGLSPAPGLAQRLVHTELTGSMGDPTGPSQFDRVSLMPLAQWQSYFANPLRRVWAQRYLQWIGDHRLELMGYEADEVRRDLSSIPFGVSGLASDAWANWLGRSNRKRAQRSIHRNRVDWPRADNGWRR